MSVTPYFTDSTGRIVIYHGDCQDLLGDLRSDLVVTDPPYGMEFRSNHRIVRHAIIEGDKRLPIELIGQCIASADNAAYLFCRWDNIKEMPPPKSVLCWVKNNWSMGDLEHEHGRQWEAICFYPKATHQFMKRIPDVLYANRTGNTLHPTQKPTDLIKQLLLANVGNSVLDPFMGSGTTLEAAKELGMSAIGIELDERYCEIAANRLAQEVLPFA